METYYAQFGEDRILHRLFNKTKGNCVEVGGFDGITGSNTYFFEKIGWRCIVIEPMPDFCKAIRAARQCEVVQLAASDRAEETEFYVATGVETLSTMEANTRHFDRIKGLSDQGIRKIKVKTARLTDILAERGMSEIDFMTIDVEGHEMSVLKGMSFDELSPRIVIIEDIWNGKSTDVDEYMKSVSYARFMRTGCNDWYARKDDVLVTPSRILRVELSALWRKSKSQVKELLGR